MSKAAKSTYRTKLYDMRIKKKLKRIDVAIAINKSLVFIEGIETGKTEPKISEGKKLAEIYDVEFDDIYLAFKEKSEI